MYKMNLLPAKMIRKTKLRRVVFLLAAAEIFIFVCLVFAGFAADRSLKNIWITTAELEIKLNDPVYFESDRIAGEARALENFIGEHDEVSIEPPLSKFDFDKFISLCESVPEGSALIHFELNEAAGSATALTSDSSKIEAHVETLGGSGHWDYVRLGQLRLVEGEGYRYVLSMGFEQ